MGHRDRPSSHTCPRWRHVTMKNPQVKTTHTHGNGENCSGRRAKLGTNAPDLYACEHYIRWAWTETPAPREATGKIWQGTRRVAVEPPDGECEIPPASCDGLPHARNCHNDVAERRSFPPQAGQLPCTLLNASCSLLLRCKRFVTSLYERIVWIRSRAGDNAGAHQHVRVW